MPSTASFSGKRMLIEINKVMDSMEAKHRSAFLDSIQKLTGNIELLAIVNDIRSGTITKIDGGVLARIDKVQVDMASLTQISRQAMGLGGKITAKTVGLEGAFDVTNEMAVDAARTISANLANVLKKSVARTIGSIIEDAVSGVDSPYETVKRIQSEIGLTPAHAQSVKIYRQNLINSGVDKARAIKQAEAYAKRLLKYRARTIARTEVSIAVNVGQLEFWKQMLSRGSLPANTKRVWIAELDGKVCGVCKPLNGELASIDGYWITAGGSFDIPHAHPNCRCTSGLVFPTPFSKADDVGYESWVISKGESAGHPFRGNQWVEGISGASEFTEEEFDGFARKTGLNWDSFPKPLKQYSFVSYSSVNINLRSGNGKPETFFDEQVIEAWASVAQEIPNDSIVFRGVTIDLLSPDFVVGDIIQNNGFTSTSRKEEIAREFIRIGNPTNKAGVLYKITIPKGIRVVPMINNPQYNFKGSGEDELLFAPTLKLKITKVVEEQGIFRVDAEVVGYETDATIENKKLIYKGDSDKSEFIGSYKEMKKRYQSEEYWEIATKGKSAH